MLKAVVLLSTIQVFIQLPTALIDYSHSIRQLALRSYKGAFADVTHTRLRICNDPYGGGTCKTWP